MGDAVVAVFVTAAQAARFALDFLAELSEFNKTHLATPIRVRVGVHAGEVEVRNRDVFGAEVNRASRVCGLADAGHILVTEPVRAAVEALRPDWSESVEWHEHGKVVLKGFEPRREILLELLDPRVQSGPQVAHGQGTLASLLSALAFLRYKMFPVLISAWLAVVFAELLVVDKILWTNSSGVLEALSDPSILLAFLVPWLAILWALILQKRQMDALETRVWRTLEAIAKHATRPWVWFGIPLAIGAVVMVRAAGTGATYRRVVLEWLAELVALASRLLAPALLVLALLALYVILRIAYSLVKLKGEEVDTAAKEWVIGNFFIGAAWLLYLVIYCRVIWNYLDDRYRLEVATGDLLNSVVYAFLGSCLLNGMYRFGWCVRSVRGMNKWYAFAIFAGGALVLAVVMLGLDLWNVERIKAGLVPHFDSSERRHVIIAHIYLRDWLLLVPLVIVIFVWLFRRVAIASTEDKRLEASSVRL